MGDFPTLGAGEALAFGLRRAVEFITFGGFPNDKACD